MIGIKRGGIMPLLGVGGAGYSWVDETANRVSETTYTNITGHPIMCLIHGTSVQFKISISSIVLNYFQSKVDYGNGQGISFIVPNGATYSYTNMSGSINSFLELK